MKKTPDIVYDAFVDHSRVASYSDVTSNMYNDPYWYINQEAGSANDADSDLVDRVIAVSIENEVRRIADENKRKNTFLGPQPYAMEFVCGDTVDVKDNITGRSFYAEVKTLYPGKKEILINPISEARLDKPTWVSTVPGKPHQEFSIVKVVKKNIKYPPFNEKK